MAALQHMRAVDTQFPCQVQRRDALGKALQDTHDHTTAVMGALPERPGKGVVNPAAGTAKIQYQRTIPPMHLGVLDRRLALGATQAIRMQDLDSGTRNISARPSRRPLRNGSSLPLPFEYFLEIAIFYPKKPGN